ncbi:hypothetical protein [Pelosinus propionicus]|uniref:DUF3649 domain-containing protein n=1 Tax=Pelosinus propionicus DSM 13327 TaxID=1123291 RepID=A0A1I4NCU4_9FIRM|nr:hypothetical protein [Pelosinus propionicus]SFM13321.1 hypothetical protein SAMN04490355_104435 [Pelosinus propionicus DSM 13327]
MNTVIQKPFKQLRELLAGTDKTTQTILRILAAVFGGYALTSSIMAVLVVLLPWEKADVLFFSVLFPPIIYTAALIWAFAAPTAQRAWRNLLVITLFCGILALAAVWVR